MDNDFVVEFGSIAESGQPVQLSDEFRKYDNWGSLMYLSLLVMIEEKYGIIIGREEFQSFVTVGDIYAYILNQLPFDKKDI